MNITTPSESRSCQVCGKDAAQADLIAAGSVRPVVVNLIRQDYPEWSAEGFICADDLNRFRYDYVRSLIETERGELSDLEKEVVDSLASHEILSMHVDQEYDSTLTFGQRLSDKIASFGGSWRFIIIFFCILVLWISVNSLILAFKPFDPYPFILLNLILSCLAAIQAPIIMMSQNRQESKDRLRSEHDYSINLKAELEIRHLHEKIDHLLMNQWQRLLEIQEIQMELMEELAHKTTRGHSD
jgi:uncharacterized membrane protein